MKKLVVLIISLVIAFLLFLFFYFRTHDYSFEYQIDDFNITEKYNKELEYYKFIITYDDKDFELIALDKYSNKRKLITDVILEEKDNGICLNLSSNDVNLYPICYSDDYYSYFSKTDSFKVNKTYQNFQIADLNNKTYFLWDYHNFLYLNSDIEDTITLFGKDLYNLNLIYQYENYLLVPDYNSDFKFNKMYLINSNNGKVKEIDLRFELYFDSYFLGDNDKKVYLYDLKNEQEYYLDLKKNEIYKNKTQVLENGKWQNYSNTKMKNDKPIFTENKVYNYYVQDNKLYMNIYDSDFKMRITDRNVSKVIKTENLGVYYVSKDTLYYFEPSIGEKALIKYSEWEFNNNNMIYIF